MSDQTSDAESYVFEDIMLQSNSASVMETDDNGNQSDSSDSTPEMHSSSYPKLMLTNEEKRLLDKEGIALPGNYPLTKHEERELKRIRRKIRNKISAQDSRKRKKEYVDGLEERVKQCTDENQTLIKRLKLLQSQHNNLTNQVKKLQAMLTKGTNKTAKPATCLMVLLLSLALVAVPNLKLGQSAKDTELAELALQDGLLQNRRNLLFDTNEQLGDALVDEEMNLDDILAYNDINEHDYADVDGSSVASSGVSAAKKSKTFIDFDVDDKVWKPNNQNSIKTEFTEKAGAYQEYIKYTHSSGGAEYLNNVELPNVNNIMMQTGGNHLYEVNLNKISMFSGNLNPDNIIINENHHGNKKMNDSKINLGEKKLLMKGA